MWHVQEGGILQRDRKAGGHINSSNGQNHCNKFKLISVLTQRKNNIAVVSSKYSTKTNCHIIPALANTLSADTIVHCRCHFFNLYIPLTFGTPSCHILLSVF